MRRDEETAFPCTETLNTGESFSPGMSLRDYFAAKAMQGILSHEGRRNYSTAIARDAYDIADAMLEVRDSA